MINIKSKIIGLGLALSLGLSTGCQEEFLDNAPFGQTTDAAFYQNTEQCMGAIMQTYNRTVHSGPIYLFVRECLAEYAGDDVLRTNVDDFTPWHNFSPDNVQFLWGWKYCYQGIYLCNYNIQKINEAPIPQADKDGFIAEAKALRGFMYYLMANRWGSVPLNIEPLAVEEYFKLPFSPAEDVYAQVEKDFKEAIPFLPKTWDGANKGRFSQVAAKHMLAKTYMMMAGYPLNKTENWQKAVDVLAEFVPADKRAEYGLQLQSDFADVFAPNNTQNTESILEINWMYLKEGSGINHEVGGPGSFFPFFVGQPSIYDGNSKDCFTADFVDDIERDGNGDIIDRRYTYTVLEPGDIWYVTRENEQNKDTIMHSSLGKLVIKNVDIDVNTNAVTYDVVSQGEQYKGWNWVGPNDEFYPNYKYMRNSTERYGWQQGAGVFGDDLNLKYLRFSDAILCYAEALNEVGRASDAVPYVNEIRQRANSTSVMDERRIYQKTVVSGTLPMIDGGTSQTALRDMIRHEWRMEIAGEGWRYESIRRWGIAEERLHAMAAKSPKKGNGNNDASKYEKGRMDYFPVTAQEFVFDLE